MNFTSIILSIIVAQIPDILLRLYPFSNMISFQRRLLLYFHYFILFILQGIFIYTVYTNSNITITPLFYKKTIAYFQLFFLIISIVLTQIKPLKQLYIFSMQSYYSLLIHSIASISHVFFFKDASIDWQILLQTAIYCLFFLIFIVPLANLFKEAAKTDYLLSKNPFFIILWIVPFLIMYSNVLIYDSSWFSIPVFISRLMLFTAFFLSWKFVLNFIQNEEKISSLEQSNKILDLERNGLKIQIERYYASEKELQIMRHDARHRLHILHLLVEEDKKKEATDLICSALDSYDYTTPIIYCKNNIINSALNVYISKATIHNIHVDIKINLPKQLPIDETDLAVFMSNAIENAIHACLELPYDDRKIKISATFHASKLFLKFENRYFGEIIFDQKGIPISKKCTNKNGFGTKSILSVANKYHGKIYFSCDENWLVLSCLFPITN